MTGRFEWHITVEKAHAVRVRALADRTEGVTFSQITGCPILGQGTYCYLTGYDTDSAKARVRMGAVVAVLEHEHVPVLRAKMEDIVFDTKTGVDRLSA